MIVPGVEIGNHQLVSLRGRRGVDAVWAARTCSALEEPSLMQTTLPTPAARRGSLGDAMKRLLFWLVLLGGAAAAAYLYLPQLQGLLGGGGAGAGAGALPVGADGCPEGMVRIEAGTFTMGKRGASGDRGPAHEVTLSAYCIDETEVTVAAYRRCVDGGGCEAPREGKHCNFGLGGREDHPVNCVTWAQADRYCRWIGGRLPTEAQWERAARGDDGRRFPWGSARATRRRAHFSKGAWLTDSLPVKSLPKGKSPYGLWQMAGNVCELVSDYYAERYPERPVTDPQGPDSGSRRVCRGGSFNNRRADAISTTFRRRGYSPGSTDELTGMRCAADPAEAE
ncbi:MAG: hypothetical protein CSA66_02360 [Proteobacteria bacterium]|nr:MAG: hypothetical protein CSA66_02360 [Pseudomonadota bacterium]